MKIAIFGTGGHASEIMDICDSLEIKEIVFITKPSDCTASDNSSTYVGENMVDSLHDAGFSFAIGLSAGVLKEKIYARFNHVHYPNLIHPHTSFGVNQRKSLEEKKGIIVAAGVRFQSSIDIGNFSTFGLNSTIGHDSIIREFVSVMPGANISGNVEIGKYSLIGSGSVILQGSHEQRLVLNSGITVGAGAVVTKSFCSAKKIIGVPARQLE
jgi:serine acetyltransferase